MTPHHMSWLGVDVSPIVPNELAQFRPLVADALVFFLERLSAARLTELVAMQCGLSAAATAEERLANLISQCPTLHKLGQVLVRDTRLPSQLRERLQPLATLEPTTPVRAVKQTIERELGKKCARALSLNSPALAETSVAVVIPFSSDGSVGMYPSNGVLKVLKPNVIERLEEELEIWSDLAAFVDERCERDGLPMLHCKEILRNVGGFLVNEVRLDLEQLHLKEAARFYADSKKIQIPAPLPCSTPRVTVMERVFGARIAETEHLSEGARKDVAGLVLKELVAKLIWSSEPWAIFHADPHAGNLVFTEDGRLAILDWSLAGYLDKTERERMAQIVLGALSRDANRILQAIAAMAIKLPDEAALRKVVAKAVTVLYRTEAPALQWLLDLLGDAMFEAKVMFGEDLVLFRKSVLTLQGVAADVSEDLSLGKMLTLSGGLELSRKWNRRRVASAISRGFGAHASGVDLLSLYFAVSSVMKRLLPTRFFDHATRVEAGSKPTSYSG
jgi:ubiquinone biosynthesis protein